MSISLMNSWKESLFLFKPSVFKQLLLVTFKSMGTFYHSLLWYGWPLLLINSTVGLGIDYVPLTIRYTLIWQIGKIIISTLYLIFICLAARASVKKKDCGYFREYYFSYQYWPAYVAVFLASYVLSLFDYYTLGNPIPAFIKDCIVYVFLFFSFDGPSLVNNIINTFKMVAYNVPAFIGLFFINLLLLISATLIFGVSIYGIMKGILPLFFSSYNSDLIRVIFFSLIGLFVGLVHLPFIINLTRVIYTKRLYDQFSLYFPDKSE